MRYKGIAKMSIWKEEDTARNESLGMQDVRLEELDLTNRSVNALRRAGCSTVGDVLHLMESETGLKNVKNCGVKSEEEIIRKVQSFKEKYQPAMSSAAAGSGAAAGKRSGTGGSNGIMIRPRGKVWYTKIEEYNISALDIENLHSCGVYYVADLYTKDFESEPGWLAIRDLFAAIVAAA